MKNIQITMIPLSKLKCSEHNANTHSDEQVKAIAESMNRVGNLVPIVVNKDYDILAGEGRYLAMQLRNDKEAPCIYADNLTEEQQRTFLLADNRIADMSVRDPNKLMIELEYLDSIDVDMSFAFPVINFDEIEDNAVKALNDAIDTQAAIDDGLGIGGETVGETLNETLPDDLECPKCGHVF